MGMEALRSPTRDQTCAPCSLNHWTARKVPGTQVFGPHKGRVISGTVLRRPWGPKEEPAPQAGVKTWSLGNWETWLAGSSPGRPTNLKVCDVCTCELWETEFNPVQPTAGAGPWDTKLGREHLV